MKIKDFERAFSNSKIESSTYHEWNVRKTTKRRKKKTNEAGLLFSAESSETHYTNFPSNKVNYYFL